MQTFPSLAPKPRTLRFWLLATTLAALFTLSVNAQIAPPVFAPSQYLDSLTDKGSKLGVQTIPATMNAEKDGRSPAAIKLQSIPAASVLRKISIEEGDIIFSVDWYYFLSTEDMRRYIRSLDAGQIVDLMFWKAKDGKNYKARLPMPGTPTSTPPCSVPQGVLQVIPNSMQEVLRKAESGSAVAQRMFGEYMNGSDEMRDITFKLDRHRPGTSNIDMARCWHKQAARNGDPTSQYEVGRMFDIGYKSVGGENTYLATHWYTKAANQGHLKSTFEIGYRYVHGKGLHIDEELGKSLILKAAAGGDTSAMHYNFCRINVDWEYKRKIGC